MNKTIESKLNKSNSALDFLSVDFDPLLALQTVDLKAPVENVQARDTISHCRDLLPTNHEDYIKINTKDKSSISKTKELKLKKEKQHKKENEIKKIKNKKSYYNDFNSNFDVYYQHKVKTMSSSGKFIDTKEENRPFYLLKCIYKEKCKVKIYIRGINQIKSILIGLLIAFDHHFNLLLMDVNEYSFDQPNKSIKYIRQLLVRGDNIVLITRK